MKRILVVFFISVLTWSCTNELYESASVEGVWELTAYNVESEFDINADGLKSTNLLNEIECANNETLTFDSNGTVSSNGTFNPFSQIALLDAGTMAYTFNVECDTEGVIGFAAGYTQNGETITYNNHNAIIKNHQLYVVFIDAIEIFSKDYKEVVEKQDLTLVYTRETSAL